MLLGSLAFPVLPLETPTYPLSWRKIIRYIRQMCTIVVNKLNRRTFVCWFEPLLCDISQ